MDVLNLVDVVVAVSAYIKVKVGKVIKIYSNFSRSAQTVRKIKETDDTQPIFRERAHRLF